MSIYQKYHRSFSIGLAIFTVSIIFAYFYGLGSHALIDPDEGRYSEISREMLESGDFITPKLNYVKYFEKPILHYWMTALSFTLFGENEFSSRFVPASLGLAGILITYLMARSLWGKKIALLSAIILSTNLLWFAVARLNIIDMTVSFFLTLAMAGFWWGVRNNTHTDRRYLLLFYSGMALATLSKGLIGIVIPGAIAFWYIAITRQWRLILRTLYWPGILLFSLVTVPWFWAVCQTNGDFFHFFFIQEHFLRYTTQMHSRYEPFWFFIPVLIGGLVPWSGLLPAMLKSSLPANFKLLGKDNTPGLFLGLWALIPFLFFSLSSSKLIPYILPCLPPLAILGGKVLDEMMSGSESKARQFVVVNGAVLLLLAIAGAVYPLWDKKIGFQALYPYTLPAAFSLLLLALSSAFFYKKRNYNSLVKAFCLLALANVVIFSRGFELKARTDSYKEIAALVLQNAAPGDIIVGYRDPMQGLFFYLKRRIVLAQVLGELKFGALQEKDPRWFIDASKLAKLWEGPQRVLLVTEERYLKDLRTLINKPIIQLGETPAGILLTNF